MWLTLLARFWYVIPLILLTLAVDHYRHDAKDARNDLAIFKGQIETLAAKAETAKVVKEKQDADKINVAVAGRDAAIAKLRVEQAKPRSGFVSGPAPGSPDSGKVCYDRNALDAALRKLDSGVSQLVGQGDQAVIDALTLLKSWPTPDKH